MTCAFRLLNLTKKIEALSEGIGATILGCLRTGFHPDEFLKSGGKVLRNFRGKFKKR
jgi:hypothetical protein